MNKIQAGMAPKVREKTIRNVEYQPPNEDVFEQLAENFCEILNKRGDLATNPEMVVGLAEFLTVVARLTAKSLSKNRVLRKP